jgi:hypothetical protein
MIPDEKKLLKAFGKVNELNFPALGDIRIGRSRLPSAKSRTFTVDRKAQSFFFPPEKCPPIEKKEVVSYRNDIISLMSMFLKQGMLICSPNFLLHLFHVALHNCLKMLLVKTFFFLYKACFLLGIKF